MVFWSRRSIKTTNPRCTKEERHHARGTHSDRGIRPQCVSSMPNVLWIIWYESQLEVIADGARKN